MIKQFFNIIFSLLVFFSCSTSYLGNEYIVDQIINYPDNYYEVLKDTNYVFQNIVGSDSFSDMLHYIKKNNLELLQSQNGIYHNIKNVTLFYNDKMKKCEIMINFTFYHSSDNKWKLKLMYYDFVNN